MQNNKKRVRPRAGGGLGGFKYAVFYSGKPGFLGGARSHAKVLAQWRAASGAQEAGWQRTVSHQPKKCDSSTQNGRFCRAALSHVTDFVNFVSP